MPVEPKFDVRKAAAQENACQYLESREYLARVFQCLKDNLPSYSYRKFAEDLGFGATNYMHLILQGHRPVSPKAADQIADHLGLKGIERRYFIELVKYQAAKNAFERENHFQALLELKSRSLTSGVDRDQLEYFSAWQHAAIREMASLPDFDPSPEWIAARIFPRLSVADVTRSLELLLRIGYLVRDPAKGTITPSQTHVRTAAEVRSIALIRYHEAMIDLAKSAVTTVPAARRDIGAVTVPLTAQAASDLKNELQALRARILATSEACKEADDVYQVNIQLFPLTAKD